MTSREIFSEIYDKKLWGHGSKKFYSGTGSAQGQISQPYIQKVSDFLRSYSSDKPRIVDLGCGDFEIGKHFVDYCSEYIGVDVVPQLIDELNRTKTTGSVRFLCLDIIEDELPDGDIVFLRQVLQHLSNEQIIKVLNKLRKYKIVFVTEHQPTPNQDIVPNKNIVAGAGIRKKMNSGVYLDEKPFNIPKDVLQLFLEVPGGSLAEEFSQGVIRTYKLQFSAKESGDK